MQLGGVILCGGQSKRMGSDKALLPFGDGDTLLSFVVQQVQQAVGDGPVVCVAAVEQPLPPLPDEVMIARDRQPDLGPLAALSIGLQQLRGKVDTVFAVGCDTPLVSPALIELVVNRLGDASAATPVVDGHRQPLLAAYKPRAADQAEVLLATGKRSLQGLLDAIAVTEVTLAELEAVDPDRHSLLNCNDQASYEQALAIATQG